LVENELYVETCTCFAGGPHYGRIDCWSQAKRRSRRSSDWSVGGLLERGVEIRREESTGRLLVLGMLKGVKTPHYGMHHQHG
jgi:hypothetical protein